MKIELHDGPVSTTPAMLSYAHNKIGATLGRFGSLVEAVRIVVRDINAPRGGMDTLCTLHARIAWRGHSVVVAADHGGDFYTAVQSASKKLKLALRRMIDRAR